MSAHDDVTAFRNRSPWDDGVEPVLSADPSLIDPLMATDREWRRRFGDLLDTITVQAGPAGSGLLIVMCWTTLTAPELHQWLGQQLEEGLPKHARIRYGFRARELVVPAAEASRWRAFTERCAMSATTATELSEAITRQPSLLDSLLVAEARLRQGFGPALQAVSADILRRHQDGLPVIDLCARTSLSPDQLHEATNRLGLSSSSSSDEHIWLTFVHA